MAVCEYAVPAHLGEVGENASKTTTNPQYREDAFRRKGAACQLKRFNDGAHLPIERLPYGGADYTCVGPNNNGCPLTQGEFILFEIESDQVSETGDRYKFTHHVTRRRLPVQQSSTGSGMV